MASSAADVLVERGTFVKAFELAAGRLGRRRAQRVCEEALDEAIAEVAERRQAAPVSEQEEDTLFWQRALEPVLSHCRRRAALRTLQELTDSCMASRAAKDAGCCTRAAEGEKENDDEGEHEDNDKDEDEGKNEDDDEVLERDVERAMNGDGWLNLRRRSSRHLGDEGFVALGRLPVSVQAALLSWAFSMPALFSASECGAPLTKMVTDALRGRGRLCGEVRSLPLEGCSFFWAGGVQGTQRWHTSQQASCLRRRGYAVLCCLGGPGLVLQVAKGSHKTFGDASIFFQDDGGAAILKATAPDLPSPQRLVTEQGAMFLLDSRTAYRWKAGCGKPAACLAFVFKDRCRTV